MNALSDENSELTAPLAARLRARIRRAGPMSFQDWMAAALYDEREGYYCRRDREVWGRAGDYRTSAERSVLFAATLARYFAAAYERLDAPGQWTIWECGAGAGRFARRVLNTLAQDYPRMFAATRYLIDEASAPARERARELLAPFGARIAFRRLGEQTAPLAAGVVFANELLDAFPVHRVRRRGGKLLELCVGLEEDDDFVWVERAPTTPLLAEYFARAGVRLAEGQLAEANLAAEQWVKKAAAAFAHSLLVIIDYGAEAAELYDAALRPAGTLRAFSRHQFADPLRQPGEQDLTASVNWTSVKRAGAEAGLAIELCARQDQFLLRAGILEVLESLTARAGDAAQTASLRLDAREMILPGGMSQSFQALVLRKGAQAGEQISEN